MAKKPPLVLGPDWRTWPKVVQEVYLKKWANAPQVSPQEILDLIKQGWRAWYAHLFGRSFVDVLDSAETDDKHHSEAIEWHWESRLALLRGQRPPNDWYAYFPTWFRGGMKTTVAERMIVTDAGLSVVFKQPGFTLYIGREKTKILEAIGNIELLLSTPPVRRMFPSLSTVKRNEETNQKRQWTGTYLHTAADYVIKGGTIESAQAGAKVGLTRPTFQVPDDIDSRTDSPVESDNILRALTTEIIPMRQANTLSFWAQNLISRYTARYRIETQQARVLTNRKPSVRVPAVRGLVTEPRTIDGFIRDIMVAGKSTWRGWDHARIQDEINAMGLPAFLSECQHEVEQSREGLVLQFWDDDVHVISYSQFARIFGTRDLPRYWTKYVGNDWARTKTKYHANVCGTVTVSPQNTRLPGCVFVFNPMSFNAGTSPEDVALRLLKTISPLTLAGHSWDELVKSTLDRKQLERFVTDTTRLIEQRRVLLSDVIPKFVAPVIRAQNYQVFRCSHERTDVQKVFRNVFGLPFQGCVDEGEVLSVSGWKPIQDVELGEPVYSLDAQGALVVKKVTATHRYWFEGNLVKVRHRSLYQSFTPDHRVVFRGDNRGGNIRVARWSSHKANAIHIVRAPLSYKTRGIAGRFGMTTETWLSFLGIWLAEGFASVRQKYTRKGTKNGFIYKVGITQSTKNKQPAITSLLNQTPWRHCLCKSGDFYISNKALCLYLMQFGKAHEKFVPREILRGASRDQLQALFDWMVFGDGSRRKTNGGIRYATSSKRLADDVAEIGVKLGRKVCLSTLAKPLSPNHHQRYMVNLTNTSITSAISKKRAEVRYAPFSGPVYCLTVEDTGTFVIRQRGKVWISGNSNPGSDGGVDTLNLLQRVDYSMAHPIVLGKKGYTRFFLVVEDDLTRPCVIDMKPVTYDDGKIVYEPMPYRETLSPDDLHDADLFRYQFRNWRLRDPYMTAKGEIEGDLLKMNDDAGNLLMMLFYDGCVQAVPLTGEERMDAMVPPGYRKEELAKRTDMNSAQKAMTGWFIEREIRKQLKPKDVPVSDYGEPLN